MSDGSDGAEDRFLGFIVKHRTPVTVYLVNGVKLQGVVPGFDSFTMLLRREGVTQLLYKHAVSSVMPAKPLQLEDGGQ